MTDIIHSYTTPNQLSDYIVAAINNVSLETLPKRKFNRHAKPNWTAEVKAAHTYSRDKRKIWLIEERPRGMYYPSCFNNKAAKREFRKPQRIASNNYINNIYRELERCSKLDSRLFWSLKKRHKKTPRQHTSEIIYKDIIFKAENVISGFEKYFTDIFVTNALNPKK